MTLRFAGIALGMMTFAAGCSSGWKPFAKEKDKDVGTRYASTPNAEALVAFMNDNAKRVQAIECDKVSIDAKQGNQQIGLEGLMACQKPRNFRLKAMVLGKPGCDIGSNDQEFWFWISKADPPYVFHCAYKDLARGNVDMPFPFQPEMIMSALGIAEYDAAKKYEVRPNGKTLELTEQTTSPSGQPMTKLTVFARDQVPAGKPQVVAHVIRDGNGKDICVATVQEVTVDPSTRAVLPRVVKIVWPGKTQAETAEMTMRFYDMHVAKVDQQWAARSPRLFSRMDLAQQQGFDLARRAVDGAPGGISQTGGAEMGQPVPGTR